MNIQKIGLHSATMFSVCMLFGTLATGQVPSVLKESQSDRVKDVLEMQQKVRWGQPSYARLKSPIESKVLDGRFITKDAMYLANEEILSGNLFMERALDAGLPVVEDSDFINITTNESYWYSRYNLSWLMAKSRMGIHLVHGPYVSMRAKAQKDLVFYNRKRGERELANREIVLGQLIPLYLSRTGFSRRFEDASPLMIEYASGDPHLTRRVDVNDDFEGGNGRVDFEDTYLSLRWNHSRMDKTFDMGAVGQTWMKQVLWCQYFFSQNHAEGARLGNTAEDGFRGAMLNLMMVSKMLLIKATLFYDGKRLTGIDPFAYEPENGLVYVPHLIRPSMIMAGDIPPRPNSYRAIDKGSELFDQGSLLWAASEFLYFSDPDIKDNWDNVFGEDFPYDGSIMEQKWRILAQGLAEVLLKNIYAMHRDTDSGALVSRWERGDKVARVLMTHDAGIAMLGLANYYERSIKSTELSDLARGLLKTQADFLADTLQRSGGAFPIGYDYNTGRALDGAPTLLAQGLAIRGLLKAYESLEDEKYLKAALKCFDYMNDVLWHDAVGIYRSEEGATTTIYTGLNLGAALGALREVILTTKNDTEIERYKRFHVQALNRSGMLQAEEGDTGERDLSEVDADKDGLLHFKDAGGKYGIAAVHAAKVAIQTP